MKINDFIETLSEISPNDLTTFYEIFDSFINNDINRSDLNNKIYQIHTNLNAKITPLKTNNQYYKIKKLRILIKYLDKLHNTISTIKQEGSVKSDQLSKNTIAQIVAYDLLDEYDFTNKNIVGFIYKNKIYPDKEYPKIITGKYLFHKTCDILFSEDSILFNRLPKISDIQGRQLTYFSYEKDSATLPGKRPLRNPKKIKSSKVYIETALNIQQITKIIKKMLSLYNTLSNYKILVLEKNPFISRENSTLLSQKIEPVLSTNTSTNEILKTKSSKKDHKKYTCVYYDAEKNFCKKTKTYNCYSAKLNCFNFKQKTDINSTKDTLSKNQVYLDNIITNNTFIKSNDIILTKNISIEKISDITIYNKKNNTITPIKKPIIYISNSISIRPSCQKNLTSNYTKILFIKNNIQKEEALLTKKCSDCNKTYVLKKIYTIFINNKDINTMNYSFLEEKPLISLTLLDTIKNNLKPNEQIIFLNDDFSKLNNSIPISLYFYDRCYSLIKWNDLLLYISQKLNLINPRKFSKLPKKTATNIDGTLHFKIAFDNKVLKSPLKIKNSSLFIDLDISLIELQTLIKQMLEIYEIDINLLFIKVKNVSAKNF